MISVVFIQVTKNGRGNGQNSSPSLNAKLTLRLVGISEG
jgi:hypothetical protein